MIDDEAGMSRALAVAKAASSRGEPPFGAVLFDAQGKMVAEASDAVIERADPTQHAETNLVRVACALLGPRLDGTTLFTTVEPCPMCFTAAWLARVERIVFGATMDDVFDATNGAQRELRTPAETMNQRCEEPLRLRGGVRAAACLALFADARVIG